MEWNCWETEHYLIYCHPESFAEEHLEEIENWQEKCYDRISKTLGVTLDKKIRLYLCASREETETETGCPPCNGMCLDYDLIFAVYNQEIQCLGPHEDAHLLSFQIAVPASVFLREGLAMYFDEAYHGKANRAYAAEWARENAGMNVFGYLDNEQFYSLPEEVSYPLAGALTRWLIDRYGMERYKEFFRTNGDISAAFQQKAEDVSAAFEAELEKGKE